MNLVELPPELLTLCFSYLNGVDLAKINQTCKLFNKIVQSERLWQQRCQNEYGLRTSVGWSATYKEIYSKVLHRFGFLPGLWRNSTSCYGGLVTIKYREDGRIVAEELYALKDIREKLRRKELFQVTLSEDQQVKTDWLGSHCGAHTCQIQPEVAGHSTTWPKTISVNWREEEAEDPTDSSNEKTAFLDESLSRGTHPDLCMYKWISHLQHLYSQNFSRLEMPTPCDKLPINMGLYKGMYGGHGTEVLMVSHDEASNKLHGMKVSGDPNVPAGEISLYIDLSSPMVLTSEQQETLGHLKTLSPDQTAPDPGAENMSQPFRIPNEIEVDDEFDFPRFCKARYYSKGTVSPMGFRNPTKIDNHFVVFDRDTFGILWLSLYSFSMFSRVQEEL